MILPAAVAHASPPSPASGSFTIVNSVPGPSRVVDDQVFFQETNTVAFAGTLTGTAVCDVRGRLSLSTGTGDFRALCPYSGTVDGVPDTFVIRFEGTLANFGATAEGRWVILGGKERANAADAHGEGTFVQVGPSGSYQGEIHFDPEK
jgi:hypothetical protein